MVTRRKSAGRSGLRSRLRFPYGRADVGVAGLTAGVTLLGGYVARKVLPPTAGRIVEGLLGAVSFAGGVTLQQRRSGVRAESVALGLASGGVAAMGRALLGEAAAVIHVPPPTTSPALVPAIYSGNNLVGEIESVQDFLQALSPPGVMLHSSMENLRDHGASITSRVQGLVPGIEVWWGITDDEHCGPHDPVTGVCTFGDLHSGVITPEQLLELRTSVGRAAAAAAIPWLVWDAEPAWTFNEPGFDQEAASASVSAVKQIVGGPRQGLTTYPQPTVHGDYPWQGWLECDAFLPNIYWGPGIGDPHGDGPTAYAGAASSIETARRVGLLSQSELIIPYLLMHGTSTAELGWVADHYEQVACWTLSGGDTTDDAGRLFMMAMVAIDRKGFRGVGRIASFQASQGIDINSKLDADTLHALGVQ